MISESWRVLERYADCIAIADKGQPLAVRPVGNDLALENHIAQLHVDPVELAERAREF